MKTLSIKQPWTELIFLGIKPVENRTWYTAHRGKILVHASGASFTSLLSSCLNMERVQEISRLCPGISNYVSDLQHSAIIGEVEIVDCVQNHPSIWADHFEIKKRKQKDGSIIPVEVPVWNWVLANPVRYKEPILNVKGALSLWEFNQDAA